MQRLSEVQLSNNSHPSRAEHLSSEEVCELCPLGPHPKGNWNNVAAPTGGGPFVSKPGCVSSPFAHQLLTRNIIGGHHFEEGKKWRAPGEFKAASGP